MLHRFVRGLRCALAVMLVIAALAPSSPALAQGDDPLWNTTPCTALSYRDNYNASTGFNFPANSGPSAITSLCSD